MNETYQDNMTEEDFSTLLDVLYSPILSKHFQIFHSVDFVSSHLFLYIYLFLIFSYQVSFTFENHYQFYEVLHIHTFLYELVLFFPYFDEKKT